MPSNLRSALSRFRSHFLSLGNSVFNGTNHVESCFRQVVIVTIAKTFKAFNVCKCLKMNEKTVCHWYTGMLQTELSQRPKLSAGLHYPKTRTPVHGY